MHLNLARSVHFKMEQLATLMDAKGNVALLLEIRQQTRAYKLTRSILDTISIVCGDWDNEVPLYSISGSDARKEAQRAELSVLGAQKFVLPLFAPVNDDDVWTDLLRVNSNDMKFHSMSQLFFTDRVDHLDLRLLFAKESIVDLAEFTLSVNAIGMHAIVEQNANRFPLIAQ